MNEFHLILSLDYELFGDGSGCIDHCLVGPTDRCRQILEKHGARLSLFVEALELERFEAVTPGAYQMIGDQLQLLKDNGHLLELHLHPQWTDAVRQGDHWILDFRRWRIGDLSETEQARCLDTGLDFMKSYDEPQVFRAGAWALQPAPKLMQLLRDRGITIDSSVAPEAYNPSSGDWFDFRTAPRSPFWQCDDDVCVADSEGATLEVPITTANIGMISHGRALLANRHGDPFPEKCHGTYAGPNTRSQDVRGKLSKLLRLGKVMLDFSTLPASALIDMTERTMARFARTGQAVPIVAIGHNKNFTTASEHHLNDYLRWAKSQPEIVFSDYRTFAKSLHT